MSLIGNIRNTAKLVSGFNITLAPLFFNEEIILADSFVNGTSKYGEAKIPGAVAVRLDNGGSCICVNNEFYKTSKEVQDTIIAHEYGHINLNHSSPVNNEDSLRIELEADLYAIKQGRDIFKMLICIASYCAIIALSDEFKVRINQAMLNQDYLDPDDIKLYNKIKVYAKTIKFLGKANLLQFFR